MNCYFQKVLINKKQFGIDIVDCIETIQTTNTMQEFIQIPTEYIEQVLEKTTGVRPNLQDELVYLRTSLSYLREGMSVEEATDLATIDYLMAS